MRTRIILLLAVASVAAGCGGERPTQNVNAGRPAAASKEAAPLPDNGFRAEITLLDPPAKLRAGQKESVQVRVRNASGVQWWARGGEINNRPDNKFYLAAANRWLEAGGKLVTDMDGRYGIGKDLGPGEQTEVPLLVTAPKEPGDYTLEVDLVQEQVSWFSDKGSPTARTKITVVQ
ncbi:MAG TPA: hypothetical protein VG148_16500 [Pyrinomonadaceae bacterium]|nr:hypothetical protein [Pyrinomonadaceae bacterium]